MDCGAYRKVKLLEHAMKIVEIVLEMIDDSEVGLETDLETDFVRSWSRT